MTPAISEKQHTLTDEQCLRHQAALLSTMNPHGPVKLKIRALAVRGLWE
jgi:hypothetical protein